MSWLLGLARDLLHGSAFQPYRQAFLPAGARDSERDLAVVGATLLVAATTYFVVREVFEAVGPRIHKTPRRKSAQAKDVKGGYGEANEVDAAMKGKERAGIAEAEPKSADEADSTSHLDVPDGKSSSIPNGVVAERSSSKGKGTSQEESSPPLPAPSIVETLGSPQDDEPATPKASTQPQNSRLPQFLETKPPEQEPRKTPTSQNGTPPQPAPSISHPTASPTRLMPPPPKPTIPSRNTSLRPSPAPTRIPSPSRSHTSTQQTNRTSALLGPSPRNPSTKSAPLAPGTSTLPTPNSTAKTRKKVILTPGHSPLDWAHLTTTTPPSTLAGVPHPLRVTPSQLAHHNGRKGRPAWSSFYGRVYNIGAYLEFHPGGKGELMRGVGKKGEALFEEVHPWVNVEGMLGRCFVGVLVGEGEGESEMEEPD